MVSNAGAGRSGLATGKYMAYARIIAATAAFWPWVRSPWRRWMTRRSTA